MKTAARKPLKPREAEIQKTAIAVLKANGIVVYRRNVMAMGGEHKGKKWFVRAGEPGQSDLWGIIPPRVLTPEARTTWGRWGRHFEAECKRPGERPTLDQIIWLIAMNEVTGAAFWFNSTEVLAKVMRCLILGGGIEYVPGTQRYGKASGPSSDYDLVYPD